MAIKFDNNVSIMDILSILAAAFSVALSVFVFAVDLKQVEIQQTHIKENMDRIESDSRQGDSEVVNQFKEWKNEQHKKLDRLEMKLDKLIDREIKRGT